MEHLHKAYDMLDRELEEIVNNGEMSKGTVDMIDELAHGMKSLKTVIAMCEAEHGTSGGTGPYYWDDGGSYARGGRGGYSRDGGYSYRGGRGGRMR